MRADSFLCKKLFLMHLNKVKTEIETEIDNILFRKTSKTLSCSICAAKVSKGQYVYIPSNQ